MRNVHISAPGFILMDEMRKNMPDTLKKVGQIGYDGIELLGFFGHTAKEIKTWCEDAGLTPIGCFVRIRDLDEEAVPEDVNTLSDFDRTLVIPGTTPEEKLQFVQDIGCRYVTLLLPDDMPVAEIARVYNKSVKLAEKHGIRLQYHNHAQEYRNQENGAYRMHAIMAALDEKVLFEPDLGWMEIGGCRCESEIEAFKNRIQIVHLKDYFREDFDVEKDFRFRPVGYGVMNWGNILPLCEKAIAPLWYTADHDTAYDGDLYEELALCLHFIKTALRYC